MYYLCHILLLIGYKYRAMEENKIKKYKNMR